MSDINPCKKAIEVTDKIIQLLIDEGMTFAEVADVPHELTRRIMKNTSKLKRETKFTLHL